MIDTSATVRRGAAVVLTRQHMEIAPGTPARIRSIGDDGRLDIVIERRNGDVRCTQIALDALRAINTATYDALRDRLLVSAN